MTLVSLKLRVLRKNPPLDLVLLWNLFLIKSLVTVTCVRHKLPSVEASVAEGCNFTQPCISGENARFQTHYSIITLIKHAGFGCLRN